MDTYNLDFYMDTSILYTTCISVYIYYIYIYSHIDPVCIYIIMIMIMINYANCSYYFLYFFGGDEPNLC